MTPEHLLLIDAILTLPETSLEKEYQRKIAAINAITAYCGVKKGTSCRRGRPGRPAGDKISTVIKAEEPAQSLSDTALNQAILSIKTEKRPIICFLCLGNPKLPISKRVFSFSSPGCLNKHFRDRHVKKLKTGQKIDYKHYNVNLVHRIHLQSHAEKFHGTILRVSE
jgi:hypothetical protein